MHLFHTFSKASILTTLLILLFSSGCMTTDKGKTSEEWAKVKETEKYQKEKQIYKSRMDNRDFCWGVGLDEFLKSAAPKPSKNCLYPTSKLVIGDDNGMLVVEKVLKQNFKQLKVLQVTPEGYLVGSPNFRNDNVVFVHKTTEDNLVDGNFLDPHQVWHIYEYSGAVSYKTALGSKTVHSFKRISKAKTENARKGLKYYRPIRDFFLENQLWGYVNDAPPSQ